MDFETTRAVAVGATVLVILIGIALTIAILGALFAPALSACVAALVSLWVTYVHPGRPTGRHAYNARQARCEGIRKAGHAYRLTGRGWEMVR